VGARDVTAQEVQQREVAEVSLFFATKGDAVVYTAKPSLYGVMEVASIQGDAVRCIVAGQVFGEMFRRSELRGASAAEKARAGEVGGARACDPVAEKAEAA
jgi:hypothetical protein